MDRTYLVPSLTIAVSNMTSISPRYSTFKLILRHGPLRRISLSLVGHSTESASNRRQIISQVYSQVAVDPRLRSCVFTCALPCLHVHVVMSPRACGHASTCTWSYIYMHMAMYPRGYVSTCIGLIDKVHNFKFNKNKIYRQRSFTHNKVYT
jgi:hypothetical protein